MTWGFESIANKLGEPRTTEVQNTVLAEETDENNRDLPMNHLQESFEDVADWCERHLEAHRGPEIGMTFGAMLRSYGRLATMPDDPDDPALVRRRRKANEKAEELLLRLSTRIIVAFGFPEPRWKKLVEPTDMRTNLTYDPGPQRES